MYSINQKFAITAIKTVIEEYLCQIKWPLERYPGDDDDALSIYSCSQNKIHSINLPEDFLSSCDLLQHYDFFHEILHAYLAEKHHVIFSALDYDETLSVDLQDDLIPLLRAANDFYVEDFQCKRFPEIFTFELKSCLRNYKSKGLSKGNCSVTDTYHFGMLASQSERYLGIKIKTRSEGDKIKRIFSKFDPADPSVDNMVKLVNKLIKVYRNIELSLQLSADGKDRWTQKSAS
ncbi:hypothetical protein [Geopsychrobacter electrodiphilus]|uniref:hypothetical protein n=1 Tax=Geopsychrobacter electrodiphilus TaxID=225196 RepID=UPI00038014EE|nr:hypothetical protein [Geopsychrobacter electrodiphilus]